MSYIDKNLLANEQIIFRTKKHLIIFFTPLLITFFCGLAYYYMQTNPLLERIILAPVIVAALFWAQTGLEYLSSDFAVTNKRVMLREGFFTRHSNELRLNAISQVNVDQSLIGQLLGYGSVAINAFGAFDTYTIIANPIAFQRAVNSQLDHISQQ